MKRMDGGWMKNTKKTVGKETTKKNEMKAGFSFFAPDAKEVFLTGEFNHWDVRSMPMKRAKDGNWKIHTILPPGRYEYKFLADSHWVEDLPSAELVANAFGTQNLILRVE